MSENKIDVVHLSNGDLITYEYLNMECKWLPSAGVINDDWDGGDIEVGVMSGKYRNVKAVISKLETDVSIEPLPTAMITKRYHKLPVQVKAVQFTKYNYTQVFKWALSIVDKVTLINASESDIALYIPTSEGDMKCSIGDYIIVEPFPTSDRTLYPCKESIFNKTYFEMGSE